MTQQHTQQIPSREEVEAFMLHWHSKLCAITGGTANFDFVVRSTAKGPEFYFGGYSPAHKAAVLNLSKTPEEVLEEMRSKIAPASLQARVAALREEADKLERGIA